MITLYDLNCDGEERGLPRFSWKIKSDDAGILQTGYRIQLAGEGGFEQPLWDSGDVKGPESLFIPYAGEPLENHSSYRWRVRIKTKEGALQEWSSPSGFRTGRGDSPWTGRFIGAPGLFREAPSRPVILNREFQADGREIQALLYATALGIYEVSLNGRVINRHSFAPGWTNYNKRLQYQCYDLTGMTVKGTNVLSVSLSPGWYAGILTWFHQNRLYGEDPAFLCDLILTDGMGHERTIGTGPDWSAGHGPFLYSEFYHGEHYDARIPDLPETTIPAELVAFEYARLLPQEGEDTAVQNEIPALSVITTPRGERVIDFGQNLTGTVRFSLKGGAGEKIVIRHAEILDSDGNFYLDNMRKAENRIEYTFKGEETESYAARFSFQGFRYIRIEEYAGELNPGDFTALVIHSVMEETLEFSCSNELLNQLHHNILWGWKGNSLDVPTDCPQRDERLGWTGDAQVFVGTASYLMDVRRFFKKWINDIVSEQKENGGIPFVVPDVLSPLSHLEEMFKSAEVATGWSDAVSICPRVIYKRYGDKSVLEDSYDAVVKWIGYMERAAEDGVHWNSGFHFGDWLALDAEEGSYLGATPNSFTATAYYARSVEIGAEMAEILGVQDDLERFRELHDRIIAFMRKEYFKAEGSLKVTTQTAHVLSLSFGIVPEEHREALAASLARMIEENGGHLNTGFLGTPLICSALSENGQSGAAYNLLLKKDYPSWLYPLSKGATTIWEHWDGLKPDGSLWSADMNSFNHYAYGAVGAWMYRNIGGLDLDGSDILNRTFQFCFNPGGGLESSRLCYNSVYGPVSCCWKALGRDAYEVEVDVPANCTGSLDCSGFTAEGYSGQSSIPLSSGTAVFRLTRQS